MRIAGMICVACLFAGTRARGDVTLSDGTFDPGDWDVSVFYTEGNGGHLDFAAQMTSGGNPGAFRAVALTVYGTDDQHPYSAFNVFHRWTPFVYHPATDGKIVSLDYAEDWINLIPGGGGQATGPALRQGGFVFIDGHAATTQLQWTHFGLARRTAADFAPVNVPNLHPDFSTSGGPIEFGFYRANSASDGQYSTAAGIDKWTITIHQEATQIDQASRGRVKSPSR